MGSRRLRTIGGLLLVTAIAYQSGRIAEQSGVATANAAEAAEVTYRDHYIASLVVGFHLLQRVPPSGGGNKDA